MCLFDHSFVHIFFVFHFVAKPMLEFRENMMFFRTVLKCSNYNYLSEKSTFFAAPEVMTEFSVAWCQSIVSQGAKVTYICTQSTQYNFASLRIVEGSAGAVVTMSQTKAVRLDFFSTSNCFSSCFLHAPVGVPFYERCNPFNNMDALSETDVIQTESPENFVVIFEILSIDKEWKGNEIMSCRCWASCGFSGRNATCQVEILEIEAAFKNNLQASLLAVCWPLLLHAVFGEWLQFSGLESFVYLY